MNLDFYRNYAAIVECGTLSAAAAKLHVAQSALSMQVRQFEQDYGACLFLRSARHMEPTQAGRIVYERAKGILALEEAAHKEVEACTAGLQGTVRIGLTQAYPDPEMRNLLTAFQEENPQLHYEFFEDSSSAVIELLRSGIAEVGIIRSSALLPADLEEHVVVRERLCICWRADRNWLPAEAEDIPLALLNDVPLAVSRGFEQSLRELFARAGCTPEIMSVSTSRSTAAMWAEAGAMAAVVCLKNSEDFSSGALLCRPLRGDSPVLAEALQAVRSVITVRGRVHSASAERFLEFCKKGVQS